MTYRKSLHSRLRKMERIENAISVEQVASHLRTGQPVKRINSDMAEQLIDFLSAAFAQNAIPAQFEQDEQAGGVAYLL